MNSVRLAFDQHAFVLWIVLVVLLAGMFIWLLTLHSRTRRVAARVDDLFGAASGDNIGKMLVEYLGTVRQTSGAVARMREEHQEIAAVMPTVIRYVGLVRFSPFHDTGGDQSFALALLDGQEDGVVVTALHSRTDSRLYAKPIEHGRSAYSLTPEERAAMDRALGRVAVESR